MFYLFLRNVYNNYLNIHFKTSNERKFHLMKYQNLNMIIIFEHRYLLTKIKPLIIMYNY